MAFDLWLRSVFLGGHSSEVSARVQQQFIDFKREKKKHFVLIMHTILVVVLLPF